MPDASAVFEKVVYFLSELGQKSHVELMVKEPVNLQYASLQNLAFCKNFLLKNIHRK